jgi:GNAT superfamily N-acetyltransferase
MADMLVRLYDLPDLDARRRKLEPLGITIRRPNVWEKPLLLEWIRLHFGAAWTAECDTAFSTRPATCFIAIANQALVGFACYDCTRLNFFGPTGVAEAARGKGIGTALLLACLQAMSANGYAYAIIGGLGPTEFYARAVGATPIEGSTPGIYDFRLLGG